MQRLEITSEILNETCYKYIFDSGLELYVFPKRRQSSNFAIFGTRFGSVHTDFSVGNQQKYHMPQGIAHFLEHKLFESEEQDAFERFTKTGASSNAYTSFDRTCYLFTCTDNFYDSYDILLDFVQSPYFTDQTVKKEQGIIGQEIKMYDDMGSWQVYMNALRALYKNIPVNVDIAGTVDEIAKITANNLYECHNAFYNPANMFICICGNVEPQEVFEFTKDRIKTQKAVDVKMIYEDEPEEICESFVSCELEVSLPQFVMAFKDKVENGIYIDNKKRIIKAMILDIIASKKSELYTTLLNQGLINADFGAEVFDGPGYCSSMFIGESSDPQKVSQMILSEIRRLKECGIDPADFEMTKRELYGNTVKAFDSVDSIINHMVDGAVCGYDFLNITEQISSITLDMLNKELRRDFDEEKLILSVVNPINSKEG